MIEHNPAVVLSHGPGGLGAVRSLARRGVHVTAVVFEDTDPVCYSRYSSKTILVPGDDDELKERNLLQILTSLPEQNAVIVTTSDRLIALISDFELDLRKKFLTSLPPADLLDSLNDKRKETELIQSLGFAIPKTISHLPVSPEGVAEELRYPIIFKPHRFSVQHIFPEKNAVINDFDELLQFYENWQHALPVFIAQEVIPGPDNASWICSCTFDLQHRMLECGIKQKIRAWPAHFGGSTCAISKHNSDVLRLAKDIGRKLNYVGHAGIEFRWDYRDEKYKYIELNPRMPANVGFDEACGLSTVWNSYMVALGESLDGAPMRQRDGIYYLDVRGDLKSMLADGIPKISILTRLLKLLLFYRTSGPYFEWSDPMPGIVVAHRFVIKRFASLLRKTRRRVSRSTAIES